MKINRILCIATRSKHTAWGIILKAADSMIICDVKGVYSVSVIWSKNEPPRLEMDFLEVVHLSNEPPRFGQVVHFSTTWAVYHLYKIDLRRSFISGWPNEIYHLPPPGFNRFLYCRRCWDSGVWFFQHLVFEHLRTSGHLTSFYRRCLKLRCPFFISFKNSKMSRKYSKMRVTFFVSLYQ